MRNTLFSVGSILGSLMLVGCAGMEHPIAEHTPAEEWAATPGVANIKTTDETPVVENKMIQHSVTDLSPKDETQPSAPQTVTQKTPENNTNSESNTPSKSTTSVSSSPIDNATGLLAQRTIYFDFDSCYIKPKYEKMLDAHARYLRHHTGDILLVEGHTDEKGSPEYNKQLGTRRAENVRHALRYRGVSEKQLKALSIGETQPKNKEHNIKAWSENRRSELIYNPK